MADSSSGLGRLLRIWHTARHLRFSQLSERVRYRLVRPKMPVDGPAPGERPRVAPEAWAPPTARKRSLDDAWGFTFLAQRSSWDEVVAGSDGQELLWHYRFHDFEDLLAEEADQRREQHATWISRWIETFEPLAPAAWDPYPISMRASNWVRWALAGGSLDDAARASLARQLRFLDTRLETHLRGNHLLENAKALYLVGSYLAGEAANRWRARGRALLREQLAEQILPDGGHCERSPMYHGLMLEAVQDCASCARVYGDSEFADELVRTIQSMDRWAQAMVHPDGGIAFFNDACHGVALPPADLHRRSAMLCEVEVAPFPAALHLPDSGFVRLMERDAVLFMDVGAPGPAWQPGHAHASALSIELSLGEQRVIVNTGTSCYGASEERLRQRGTLAHSTVCLEGRNSSEVWSGFRVARRASLHDAYVGEGPEPSEVRAGAELRGYVGVAKKNAVHARTVDWLPIGDYSVLSVNDWISAAATVSFHLHPDVEVLGIKVDPLVDGAPALHLRAGGRELWLRLDEERAWEPGDASATVGASIVDTVSVEESVYAPQFGVELPNHVLRFEVPASAIGARRTYTRISWS